uniref:Uncharacterized protein n=1 Tax=Myoviridae sp. ctro722 TaxID=2827615 RepID=A0A8S5LLK0_9CAUD|nr:MAG TPA: hypothetical protein [Myoviridae sp. ctro722]
MTGLYIFLPYDFNKLLFLKENGSASFEES